MELTLSERESSGVQSVMSLLELFDLTKDLGDAVTSPEASKPMSRALFWTIVAGVAGFFVLFGWLYLHGHLR